MKELTQHHIHYKFNGEVKEWDSTWLFAEHGLLNYFGYLFPRYELRENDKKEDFQEEDLGWENIIPEEMETEIIDERINIGGSQ